MTVNRSLIVVGTEPVAGAGGISTALEGYLQGISKLGVEYHLVISHKGNEGTLTGLKRWAKELITTYKLIKAAKNRNQLPVIWLHPAAWLSTTRKWSFALLSRMLGAHVIVHIHSYSVERYLNHPIKQLFPKLLLGTANEIFVLTSWWKNRLEKVVKNKAITIVPNPVNESLLANAQSKVQTHELNTDGPTDEQPVINIVAMSRIVAGKGFEKLIQTMVLAKSNYVLHIAGDGALKHELEELAVALGVQNRVHFTGWLDAKQKVDLLSQSDVFCLPSQNDSFGMVFIEAMACHVPVVALDFGGVSDVVRDQQSGVLLKQDSPEAILTGIEQAIANSQALKENAIKQIVKEYSPEAVASIVKDRMERINAN